MEISRYLWTEKSSAYVVLLFQQLFYKNVKYMASFIQAFTLCYRSNSNGIDDRISSLEKQTEGKKDFKVIDVCYGEI